MLSEIQDRRWNTILTDLIIRRLVCNEGDSFFLLPVEEWNDNVRLKRGFVGQGLKRYQWYKMSGKTAGFSA